MQGRVGVDLSPARCRGAGLPAPLPDRPRAGLEASFQGPKKTIADFGREARTPCDRTLAAIRTALEAAGVTVEANGAGPDARLRQHPRQPPDQD